MMGKSLLCFVELWKINHPKIENSTCKILSVQLENSVSPLIFNEFQHFWFQNPDCAVFIIREILKIKQKAFVLLLVKRRALFSGGGEGLGDNR